MSQLLIKNNINAFSITKTQSTINLNSIEKHS